jgi:hypothetical protein
VLIDRFLPRPDVTEAQSADVSVGWQATYTAIRSADLDDPILNVLPPLPAMPQRPITGAPGEVTIGRLIAKGTEWVLLSEIPGIELVIGSVGRFWPYAAAGVKAADFVRLYEPGYTKVVVSFTVVPRGPSGATLGCEVRIGATDETSRKWFRRYWRVVRPGGAMFIRRVLSLIKRRAETLEPVAA